MESKEELEMLDQYKRTLREKFGKMTLHQAEQIVIDWAVVVYGDGEGPQTEQDFKDAVWNLIDVREQASPKRNQQIADMNNSRDENVSNTPDDFGNLS